MKFKIPYLTIQQVAGQIAPENKKALYIDKAIKYNPDLEVHIFRGILEKVVTFADLEVVMSDVAYANHNFSVIPIFYNSSRGSEYSTYKVRDVYIQHWTQLTYMEDGVVIQAPKSTNAPMMTTVPGMSNFSFLLMISLMSEKGHLITNGDTVFLKWANGHIFEINDLYNC